MQTTNNNTKNSDSDLVIQICEIRSDFYTVQKQAK